MEKETLKNRLWHAITLEISEEKIKEIVDRIKEIDTETDADPEETSKEDISGEIIGDWLCLGQVDSFKTMKILLDSRKDFVLPTYLQLEGLSQKERVKFFSGVKKGINAFVPIIIAQLNDGIAVYCLGTKKLTWLKKVGRNTSILLLLHKR